MLLCFAPQGHHTEAIVQVPYFSLGIVSGTYVGRINCMQCNIYSTYSLPVYF